MRRRQRKLRPWVTGATLLVGAVLVYVFYDILSSGLGLGTAAAGPGRGLLLQEAQRVALEAGLPIDELCNATSLVNNTVFADPINIEQALNLQPSVRGFQNKQDMLNPIQWMEANKELRANETAEWVAALSREEPDCMNVQPPYQYPGCLVHINHHYKFIWIKGKKVGGTTIREPLGWICGDSWRVGRDADMTYCSERSYANSSITVAEARQYWKDYFVFAFVRNPYSRYASGYTYIERMMLNPERRVSFAKACQHPFFQAARSRTKQALDHNIHHIMEQGSCLFTETGGLAVDFIGQTESLREDLETVMAEVNKRKPAELAPLEMPEEMRTRNANQRDNYALDLYYKHPECLAEVEKHFWIDFRRLGFEKITARFAISDSSV